MIDLIELLIGLFFTGAIYYAKYLYGTRAMLELTAVFIVTAVLAVMFFTEIMKSVVEEAEAEDNADNKRTCSFDRVKKYTAYYMLAMSTSVFERIVNWCSETLGLDGEKGDFYD